MKLLIITDAWRPQVNGVVRTYEHLQEELQKSGHEVVVIGPADFPACLPMPGYSEIKLAIAPYRRLKRIIESHAPDNIHIPTEGPLGWAARRYCIKHKKPFSTAFHTHFPDYTAKRIAKFAPALYKLTHALGIKYVRRFHRPSSLIMVATGSLEDTLRAWGFQNPMHRVTRGANLSLFTPGPKTKYQDLKTPVALYVGRIAIEKNIEDFLKMNWNGSKVLIGDGPSREELEQKYPDARFLGIRQGEDLAAHYRSADIFIFPSRTDTFGMVLIEALASGIPVAAYNVPGPKDIVTESALGALHETCLETAAQRALTAGTPEQRAAHVKKHFTWETAGRQYEDGLLNKVK
ncbi:MAG: glycosyltransferase family 1 protein [Alphaproteobacteria bacterium]